MPYRAQDLGYCSNVHAGDDWPSVRDNLLGPIRAVRERRALDRMSAGLWLSAAAAAQLDADPAPLIDALARARIDLVTLNGFPFGDFHATRVKERVYGPAWDAPERLDYTLALARLLAICLPTSVAVGTISTLPLGYTQGWGAERDAAGLGQLCRLASGLARLADDTGRRICVCLEPEPDCALETTAQAIELFTERLPAAARRSSVALADVVDHLGLCFDICHQAVQFEDVGQSLANLWAAGIVIGKVQVSSALTVDDPARAGSALEPFAEPRYLHQVRCREPDGTITASPDLEAALADPRFPRCGQWRVHFHVPIQQTMPGPGGLGTTSGAIDAVLDHLAVLGIGAGVIDTDTRPQPKPQLEVETYTWQVLPEPRRPRGEASLVTGLAGELAWLEARMSARGLLSRDRDDGLATSPP